MALTPPNKNRGDTTRFKRFGGRAPHSHESSLRIFRVDSALETRLRNTYTSQFLCDRKGDQRFIYFLLLVGYLDTCFQNLYIEMTACPLIKVSKIVKYACMHGQICMHFDVRRPDQWLDHACMQIWLACKFACGRADLTPSCST